MSGEDEVAWMTLRNNFSIKLICAALELRETFFFPESVIWNPPVPSKVSFFVWAASLAIFLQLISFREESGLW